MINSTNAWVSIVIISKLELALEVKALPLPFADQTTRGIVANWERSKLGKKGAPL